MGVATFAGGKVGMAAPGSLPAGYTKLVYIESNGTQYIDTGFAPNQNTRVVCKAVCPVGSSTNFLLGARTSSSSNNFIFAASTSGYYTTGYGSTQTGFSADYNSDGVIIVDKNKEVTTLTLENGTVGMVTGTYASFSAPCNLVLCGCNTNGSISYGKDKIYSCQIYDNGTLVRNFVPCISIADTVGLYDMVNGKFYPSMGSGNFIGSEVA